MFDIGTKIVYIDDQSVRLLKINETYTVSATGLYSNGDFYVTLKEIDKIEKYLGYPSILFKSLTEYRKQKLNKISEYAKETI